jgi:hypothetical protein
VKMTSAKCPFSTLQAAGITNCQLASQVVRRGGSEFDCTQSEALATCQAMSRQLIKIGLPALGFEDDLVATPKSAYDRALFGGLIGLNQCLEDLSEELHKQDIWPLVEAATQRFPDHADLPRQSLESAIQAWKPGRRRHRKR